MQLLGYSFRIAGLHGYYFADFGGSRSHSTTVEIIKSKLGICTWTSIIRDTRFEKSCSSSMCCFPEFDTKEHLLAFIMYLNSRYGIDDCFINLKFFI